jgi:hypothetical protein
MKIRGISDTQDRRRPPMMNESSPLSPTVFLLLHLTNTIQYSVVDGFLFPTIPPNTVLYSSFSASDEFSSAPRIMAGPLLPSVLSLKPTNAVLFY